MQELYTRVSKRANNQTNRTRFLQIKEKTIAKKYLPLMQDSLGFLIEQAQASLCVAKSSQVWLAMSFPVTSHILLTEGKIVINACNLDIIMRTMGEPQCGNLKFAHADPLHSERAGETMPSPRTIQSWLTANIANLSLISLHFKVKHGAALPSTPSLFRSSESRYIGKSGTPVSGMRLNTDMEDYPEVPRALRFLHVFSSCNCHCSCYSYTRKGQNLRKLFSSYTQSLQKLKILHSRCPTQVWKKQYTLHNRAFVHQRGKHTTAIAMYSYWPLKQRSANQTETTFLFSRLLGRKGRRS